MLGPIAFLLGVGSLCGAYAADIHEYNRVEKLFREPSNYKKFSYDDEESKLYDHLSKNFWDDNHETRFDFAQRYKKEHPEEPSKPMAYYEYLWFKQYCEKHLKGEYNDYQARQLTGLNSMCRFIQWSGAKSKKDLKPVDYFKYG